MPIASPASLSAVLVISALALCACENERKEVDPSIGNASTTGSGAGGGTGSGTGGGTGGGTGSGTGAGGGDLIAPACDETAASDDVSGAWVVEFGIFFETMELEQTGACITGTMCHPDDDECYAILGAIAGGEITLVGRAAEGDLDGRLTLNADGTELFGSLHQTKCGCSGDHKFIRP